jgi:hypothetical protein
MASIRFMAVFSVLVRVFIDWMELTIKKKCVSVPLPLREVDECCRSRPVSCSKRSDETESCRHFELEERGGLDYCGSFLSSDFWVSAALYLLSKSCQQSCFSDLNHFLCTSEQ